MSPPLLEIALPVGISFFTFHAISYVIDIGRGQLRPLRLDELALYMSFFPHLVAGPIVRASEFAPQLHVRADPRRIPSGEAFRLIAFGLFKKVVVSSYVATEIVDPVFGAPSAHGPLDLLVGVYAYAIQIYADFSGYTDIAIGCALLLGIRFPQNFDAPYRALSIQDFWRRWHMTLSRWLRDYLYIPLGGSRHGERQTYRNLFLTMVIGGLWHGAAMTFLVWGALHGGYLVGERWVKERWAADAPRARAARRASPPSSSGCSPSTWCAWRGSSSAPSRIGTAFEVIGGIVAGTQPNELVTGLLLATIALMLASQFVPPRAVERAQVRFTALGPGLQVAVPGRRPHRHRRPRPRRRRPLHLLQVLMTRHSTSTTRLATHPLGREPPLAGGSATAAPSTAAGEQPAGRVLLTMVRGAGAGGAGERRRAGRAGGAQAARARPRPVAARSGTRCRTSPTSPRSAACATSATGWSGNEDEGGGGVPLDGRPRRRARRRWCDPPCARPTADEPLRVYIGGDSIIRDAGDAFLNLASDSPLFETTLHYENATGLTRPDFYDWPAAFREDMATHRPEVAFVLFGGNDSQGIIGPNGEAFPGPSDPRWREEYARRVAGVMDILRADDRIVYWVGLPPMRDDGLRRPRRDHERDLPRGGREPAVDDLPRHRTRSSATTTASTSSARPIASGDLVDLRQEDGVHLSQPGATHARPRDARPDRRGDPGRAARRRHATTAGG